MDGPGGARRRWDADQAVAAASALGLLVVVALLLGDALVAPRRRPPADPIARFEAVEGGVSWRAAGTLAWEGATGFQPLAAGDVVFVQPGGSARLGFRGGATVELEERTLVVVEPPDSSAERLQVVEGAVVASAGAAGLAVRTAAGEAVVAPGSAVAVEPGRRPELLEGRAVLGGEAAVAGARVALVAPARGHRVYVQQFPAPVALRWDGEAARAARLEVSRDRAFAAPVATAPGAAGFAELQLDGAGPWYWRIADAAGRPQSEVRKLMAVADRPPRAFSPAAGEVVLAPQGVQVPFWWTTVAGAAAYRVEVATDAAFARIQLSEPANGPGLWASLDLPEGVYFWRVRAERAQDADHPAPPSSPVAFRLIHRPILDAPRLFDASIEGASDAR